MEMYNEENESLRTKNNDKNANEPMDLGYSEENDSIVCPICGLRFLPNEPNQKVCDECNRRKPRTRNLDKTSVYFKGENILGSYMESSDGKVAKVKLKFFGWILVVFGFLALTYAMEYLINEVAKIGVV